MPRVNLRSLIAFVSLTIVASAFPVLAGAGPAHALVPNCDIDCTGGDPTGPGTPTSPTPPPPTCSTNQNHAETANFGSIPAVAGANDVAAGANGSVWYITSSGTFNLNGGSIPKGGTRVAVDPAGNPWIVDFNGNIWRSSGGQLTLMPGLARDIGIGANGAVWVIGTNSRNDAYQVWAWNGSSWVADPGSGEEIDVDGVGRPVVNGADGKIWIKDGGADQGWTQLTGYADDMGITPLACATAEPGVPGGPEFWIVGHLGGGGSVWNLFNGVWVQSTNVVSGVRQIAVDTTGTPWAVDSVGELLRGSVNP